MDYGRKDRRQEAVFSKKLKAGKRRTYFFDVRKTKGDDYYVTMTESTRKFNGNGYERHKLFLYKEDFNRFLEYLEETIDHVKTELMPDYDYDEYKKKHEEWERKRAEEDATGNYGDDDSTDDSDGSDDDNDDDSKEDAMESGIESEDDIAW